MKWSEAKGYRQWDFVADMNFDGHVTISDVWLWVKWLYFYPGDLLLSIIIGTPFGRFFEVSPNNFGGFLSFLLSLPIWVVILAALGRALIFTFDDEYRYDLLARAKEKHKQEQTEDAGKNILFRRQPWWVAILAVVFSYLILFTVIAAFSRG